jgi:lysophospholipase L1-like esterase
MKPMRVLLVLLLTPFASSALAHTLVTFGDSVTATRGDVEIYSAILAADLLFEGKPVQVINAGVGGNTTAMALKRFDADVLQKQPGTAVLMLGINDSMVDVWKQPPATQSRVALDAYKANLVTMVKQLKERGIRIVLMTPNSLKWTDALRKLYAQPPYRPEDPDGLNVLLRDYAEAVRGVAKQEGTGLVDVFALFQAYEAASPAANYRPLSRDGMHPESEGHQLIASALMQALSALDSRFARKPGTVWTPSGEVNEVHPLATDITHDAPGPAVLGPALVKLADGAVMSVFSTPTSYAGKPGECFIAGRTTRDGGKTWEPVRELTRLPRGRAAHPTVHRTRDGAIHVFFLGYIKFEWDKEHINPTEQCRSDLWTARSTDDGKTWSEPQMIFQGYTGSTNGAEETRDGRLVVPFSHYVAGPGRLVAKTVSSGDGGRTWEPSNALDIGGAGDHDGALEPCVIELTDGRLWMLIRTTRKVFWESFSADGGRTWSPANATTIDSTSAPAHVIRLTDGRLAMAWNRAKGGRTRLHLALSADDGKTWTPSFIAVRGSTTYPFVLEAKPGELWVGYMDAHAGWGTSPRARHFKVSVSHLQP